MTTRHAGYVVVLDDDVREDDAEHIIHALKMIKGVVSVRPVESDLAMIMARERVRQQVESKLYDFTRHLFKEEPS